MKTTMTKFLTSLGLLALALASPAFAQGDGARTYWHTLAGANAANFWYLNASGNANPADSAHVVLPKSSIDANLAMLGFHKELPIFGRSARVSALLPVGNLNSDVAIVNPVTNIKTEEHESSSGFGDLGLQFDINLYGAPALTNLADMIRYEPDFTLDFLATMNFPMGQYDDDKSVNLGQHRWYGRIGVPMMYAFNRWVPWVPGDRTTVELLPAVWFFGDNSDFLNPATSKHTTLSTDPLLQLEGHITRDLTEAFWVSADVLWVAGGKSTLDGPASNFLSGKDLDRLAIGPTLAFQLTDSFTLAASYSATINDTSSSKFSGNEFRLALTYGWHPLVEGMKRLKEARE